MQNLAYKKPFITLFTNEATTLPLPRELAAVEITVVAGEIRYELVGITEEEFNSLDDSMYIFLWRNNAGELGEVRAIQYLEVVSGTPDTYYVVVSEPFSLADNTYGVSYVDITDWEPSLSVDCTSGVISIGGVEGIESGNTRVFLASKPVPPVVLTTSSGDYSVTNTRQNSITVA